MVSTKRIMGSFVLCMSLGACPSGPMPDGPDDVDLVLPPADDMRQPDDLRQQTGAAPTITMVSPTSATNAGGTMITITGTNFQSNATVTVGGAALTGATITATQITGMVPAKAATCGAAPIVV